MTAAQLAIVIPVLNEAHGIESALKALAPMRAHGVQVIVVDGGSHDDTVALAQPLVDYVLTCAKGRARQMNAGAARATATNLLFLHADTRLPIDANEQVLAALGAGAVWGRFDVSIEGTSPMLRVVAACMNLRSRLSGIATGDQAIFVRTDSFVQVGEFPDQALMEDIELSKRLKRLSRPACLSAHVVTSGRRWETRGVWRTIVLMWSLRWRYWCGASPEQLARAYH